MSRAPATSDGVPQEVFLTAEEDALRRAELKRVGNILTIPRLRLIGFTLLAAVGVPLHNVVITQNFAFAPFAIFLAIVPLYCAVSWALLIRYYDSASSLDLGELFLYLDLAVVAGAVYVTGGQNSWFFWLPLMRVFDQAIHGFKRAMSFVYASTMIFIALWLYLLLVEQRTMNLTAEIAKTIFIGIAGYYIALTSSVVQLVRRKLSQTMDFARDSAVQLKRKSDELLEARIKAEQASQSKSEFLARVSHELRRPATTVIGFAQLLEMGELPPKQLEYTSRILRSGQELGVMLDEVMDLADIESGVFRLTPEELSLAQITEESLGMLWPLAAARGVHIISESPQEELRVWADHRALRRALLNTIAHVVRRGEPEEKVKVTTERAGDWARITVHCSTPAGATEVDEVFSIANPTDNATARTRELSLGLAFAKELIMAMNGRVGAKPNSDEGSTYWLDVPLARTRVSTPVSTI